MCVHGLQKQIALAFLALIDFPGIFCHNNRRCPLFFFLFKFSQRNNGRSTIYLMLSLADDSDVRCSAAHYCAHGWLLEHRRAERKRDDASSLVNATEKALFPSSICMGKLYDASAHISAPPPQKGSFIIYSMHPTSCCKTHKKCSLFHVFCKLRSAK